MLVLLRVRRRGTVRGITDPADAISYLPVFADAAQAAGRVTFNVLVLAVAVAVFIGWRRRRARGERAIGWLAGFVVLCVLALGVLAGASQA